MLRPIIALMICCFLSMSSIYSQTWQTKGNQGFTNKGIRDVVLATDSRDTVYMLYVEQPSSTKSVSLQRWNGNNWELVGPARFAGNNSQYADIGFDENDMPYVSFADGSQSYNTSVMKFDGTNWVYVGSPGFTVSDGMYTSIEVVSSNEIYVSYQDDNSWDYCSVMMYDGTSWSQVGSEGFSLGKITDNDLTMNNDTLYVVYRDFGYGFDIVLKKFNGTNWVTVGSEGITDHQCSFVKLFFDPDDRPVIGYQDSDNEQKPVAQYFDGVDWELYGESGFSDGTAYSTNFSLDSNGTPYCIYMDDENGGGVSIKKFDGVKWSYIGSPSFSPGQANHGSVLIRKNGNILAAFSDATLNQRGTVMEYKDCNINKTVTQSGYTFTAQAQAATFQWLNCSNGYAVVSGETSQSFTTHDRGEYAVEISSSGCIDTSTCYVIDDSWMKSFGSTILDHIEDVVTDDQGNVFITGQIRGDNDINFDISTHMTGTNAQDHIYLQKYNPSGRLLWTRLLGAYDNNDEEGCAIVIDHANNIVLTGTFSSTVDFDPGTADSSITAGGKDIFIAKYTTEGKLMWAGNIGGSSTSAVRDIGVDSENSVYLIGNFYSTVDFDPGTANYPQSSNGVNDVFFLKLNSSGDFVWVKTFGGSTHENGYSLAVDQSDNVIISGTFLSSNIDFDPGAGTDIISSAGDYDIFLSKYDKNGNYFWTKAFQNSTDLKIPGNVICDSLNNIYLNGSFDGQVDFDPGVGVTTLTSMGGNYDSFVLKLDASGSFVWVSQLGGVGTENGYDMQLDRNGNLAIAGRFNSYTDLDPGSGVYNWSGPIPSICILDTLGNFVDFKPVGAVPYDISVDPYNNYFISGIFYGITDFNLMDEIITLEDNGSGDAFLVKLADNCLVSSSTNISACDSLLYTDGNTYYSSVNFNTSISGLGACDTSQTVYLTVLESSYGTLSATNCNSYISPSGNYTWTTSGFYSDTITNAAGCDSVISVSLVIDSVYNINQFMGICFGDSVMLEGSFQNLSGIYFDTLQSSLGCDSIIATNLTIYDTSLVYDAITICLGDSVLIDGTYQFSQGTYFEHYSTIHGCDSIKSVELIVNDVQVSLTANADTLIAVPGGLDYQWADCIYDTIIVTTTDSLFVPDVTSSYYVIASDQGCVDTSACIYVNISAIEKSVADQLILYPNPVANLLTVEFNTQAQSVQYAVYDIYGKKIMEGRHNAAAKIFNLDVQSLSSGKYFLKLRTAEEEINIPFVKL